MFIVIFTNDQIEVFIQALGISPLFQNKAGSNLDLFMTAIHSYVGDLSINRLGFMSLHLVWQGHRQGEGLLHGRESSRYSQWFSGGQNYWLNSETPIEEVPLLSPCPPTTTTPPTTMLSQNSGYIATRDTKLLPHLNGDPRSKTQNLKPKSHATMELWT